MIAAIVCVDENWAIGKDNDLLYRIPDDMRRFKDMTMGSIVVMGRKTLDTLPNPEKGLSDRVNIVLSRDENFKSTDYYKVYHTIDDLLSFIVDNCKDVYIIGGSEIYSQLIDICDMIFITKVHSTTVDANKFFPNIDNDDNWVKVTDEAYQYKNLEYEYLTYRRSIKYLSEKILGMVSKI